MGFRMWGSRRHKRNTGSARAFAVLFTLALLPGGCFGETFQRGYVLPDGALEQIPLGASQEQVLLVLGTPSTVATVSGEAFYSEYGMKDGKVFDFISRTTPTTGAENNIITYLFRTIKGQGS